VTHAHEHGGPECRMLFEKLSEYLDGELDPALYPRFEAHLHDCEPCQAFLESLRRTVRHVGAAGEVDLPPDVRREVMAAYEKARSGGRS
jgi:anti-sigma factor RsiW